MAGNILIFLAGLAIYAGYGLPGLVWLLGITALSYAVGRLTPKHPWTGAVCAAVSALSLLTLRLLKLTEMTFAAPLGASYFTLRVISYNLDIRRGKYPPERNFFRYALYVTFLPQIFLGPIERYDTMASALDSRRVSWDGVSCGGARVLWGLFKKLSIASRAGVIVSAISGAPETYRGAYALAACLLYAAQLYADFSGGIDIVLGVCRMLGLSMSENFDAPYLAESMQEFWRRWHITLGAWLRDYVYIPLGGSRKGKLRKALNCMATFLVSGLWHGTEYLLWGLLNGVFVALGGCLKTRWRTVNRLLTFLLVSILWAFFIWPDPRTALPMIASIFAAFDAGAFLSGVGTLGLNAGEWIVLALSTAALGIYDIRRGHIAARFAAMQPAARTAVIAALGLVVLVFGMYGIGFNAEDFIYSRF